MDKIYALVLIVLVGSTPYGQDLCSSFDCFSWKRPLWTRFMLEF